MIPQFFSSESNTVTLKKNKRLNVVAILDASYNDNSVNEHQRNICRNPNIIMNNSDISLTSLILL